MLTRLSAKAPVPVKTTPGKINVFPAIFSPQDLRYLKDVFSDFGFSAAFLPDYSDTLDGPSWSDYELIPAGGLPVEEVKTFCSAEASVAFGAVLACRPDLSGAAYLENACKVKAYHLGVPIGLRESDAFFDLLKDLSGKDIPQRYRKERGRLVDAYVDGHKYIYGKRAVVYGEEDLVAGIAAFLSEIGIEPVVCASGGKSGFLKAAVERLNLCPQKGVVADGADFMSIAAMAREAGPDIIIGSSKGYSLARELKVPLVRAAFPVHDRIGAARITLCGYGGTLAFYDRIVNALLERKQSNSDVGYGYL